MSQQQLEPAVWSNTRIRLPSIIRKFLDRYQRKRNGGHKTYHIFVQNLSSLLLDLPVEIIVLISSFLPLASRLLLSLSSKRLRVIITSHFDLRLTDRDQKLVFAQWLLMKAPDLLVCRICACIYKWRHHERTGYRCPRRHDDASKYRHLAFPDLCIRHNVVMGQEMVDLILRAHYRGLEHGIPASYVDHECDGYDHNPKWFPTDPSWDKKRWEGRIVNGEFFLARTYVLVGDFPLSNSEVEHISRQQTCMHRLSTDMQRILYGTTYWNLERSMCFEVHKCDNCATDFKVELSLRPADGLVRTKVSIWQNYGKEFLCKLHAGPLWWQMVPAKLENVETARRDLERDFVAAIEKTTSTEIEVQSVIASDLSRT